MVSLDKVIRVTVFPPIDKPMMGQFWHISLYQPGLRDSLLHNPLSLFRGKHTQPALNFLPV